MQLGKKRYLLIITLGFLLVLLTWLGTGCQPITNIGKSTENAPMVKVEVYFTGTSQPMPGYLKSVNLEKDGMFFQGGSSNIPLYDEQGNLKALVNYGRVEYIKVLP